MAERELPLLTLSEEVEKIPFADLIIKCEDKEFKIHRVLVCRKSEVLTKALVGGFAAKKQEIVLHDDDPMAIERMLLFCYTDDYDDSGTESRKPLKEQALEAGDGKGGQNTSGGPWSSFQSSNVSSGSPPNVSKETTKWFDTSDRLLSNACVYAVADKYCVSSLKALARSKFESLIKHDRLTKNFPSIALAVFESTPAIERGLRELVVDKAMKHLDTVLKDTEFLEVMLSEAQLPIDLLLRGHGEHSELSKQMLSIVDSYEAKIDTLKQDSAKSEQEVVASCEAKMGAFNQKLAKLQLEIAEPNHEITSYKAGIDTFKQKMAKLEQEYTASAEAGMDAVKQEVAKIKQRYAASSEARMDAFKQEIEKSKQKIAASYQARIDAFKQKAAGSEQEALQSRQELVKLRQDKYNLNASLTSLRQTMELKDRILEQTDDCRHCGAEFDCLFYAGEDCLRCAESGISAKIKTEEYGATEKARSS